MVTWNKPLSLGMKVTDDIFAELENELFKLIEIDSPYKGSTPMEIVHKERTGLIDEDFMREFWWIIDVMGYYRKYYDNDDDDNIKDMFRWCRSNTYTNYYHDEWQTRDYDNENDSECVRKYCRDYNRDYGAEPTDHGTATLDRTKNSNEDFIYLNRYNIVPESVENYAIGGRECIGVDTGLEFFGCEKEIAIPITDADSKFSAGDFVSLTDFIVSGKDYSGYYFINHVDTNNVYLTIDNFESFTTPSGTYLNKIGEYTKSPRLQIGDVIEFESLGNKRIKISDIENQRTCIKVTFLLDARDGEELDGADVYNIEIPSTTNDSLTECKVYAGGFRGGGWGTDIKTYEHIYQIRKIIEKLRYVDTIFDLWLESHEYQHYYSDDDDTIDEVRDGWHRPQYSYSSTNGSSSTCWNTPTRILNPYETNSPVKIDMATAIIQYSVDYISGNVYGTGFNVSFNFGSLGDFTSSAIYGEDVVDRLIYEEFSLSNSGYQAVMNNQETEDVTITIDRSSVPSYSQGGTTYKEAAIEVFPEDGLTGYKYRRCHLKFEVL